MQNVNDVVLPEVEIQTESSKPVVTSPAPTQQPLTAASLQVSYPSDAEPVTPTQDTSTRTEVATEGPAEPSQESQASDKPVGFQEPDQDRPTFTKEAEKPGELGQEVPTTTEKSDKLSDEPITEEPCQENQRTLTPTEEPGQVQTAEEPIEVPTVEEPSQEVPATTEEPSQTDIKEPVELSETERSPATIDKDSEDTQSQGDAVLPSKELSRDGDPQQQ